MTQHGAGPLAIQPAVIPNGLNLRRIEDQEFRNLCPILSVCPLPFVWNVPDYVRNTDTLQACLLAVGPHIETTMKKIHEVAKDVGENVYIMGFHVTGEVYQVTDENNFSISYNWESWTLRPIFGHYPYIIDLNGYVYYPLRDIVERKFKPEG